MREQRSPRRVGRSPMEDEDTEGDRVREGVPLN